MNGNLNGFNANDAPEPMSFDPLPEGEYMATITGSEMKATIKGDGSYLSLEYTIIDGPYANRKVWDNLNLDNPNAKSVTIAQASLGAICKACAASSGNAQLETPNDSSELHDIPLLIKLAIKNDQNVFRKWSPVNQTQQTNQPQQSAMQNSPQQGNQQAANNTPAAPWSPKSEIIAKLPEKKTTVDAIYEHYESNQDGHRAHLGASEIGHECERYLWYKFRHAFNVVFKGRMLRLFQRGHNEEHTFNKELRDIGIEVVEVDSATGKQYSFKQKDNQHFGGSMDAAALGLIEAPKTWHVIDYKTANQKKFTQFEKGGTKNTAPNYYAQLIMYMFWSGMTRAMIMIANKNDDSIYTERFEANASEAKAYIEKAKRIVFTNKPASKIGDASFYLCKFCDAYDVCHQSKVPEDNCRTCCHSTPNVDGTWQCDRHGYDLIHKDQLLGCGDHLYLPDLVPAKMLKGDTKENWIMYKKENGVKFVNAGTTIRAKNFNYDNEVVADYTSTEIKNGFDVLGEEKLEMVRDELGAKISAKK